MAGYVTRMGKWEMRTVLVGKSEGKRPFEKVGVDGRTILKWILKEDGVKIWTGFSWFRIRSSGGLL
jgi:hypothetical protein